MKFCKLCILAVFLIGAAQASKLPPTQTVDAMLSQSAVVILATVVNIDEQAFDSKENQPKTRISFGIDEVVYGTYSNTTLDVTLRGGLLPDGSYVEISTVPKFSLGHQYLLFYRSGKYFTHPFVRSRLAILRKTTNNLFVDREGYGIRVSTGHGLMLYGKVANSMRTARLQQMQTHATLDEGKLLPETQASVASFNQATTTENILGHIRHRVRRLPMPMREASHVPLHTVPSPILQKDGGL